MISKAVADTKTMKFSYSNRTTYPHSICFVMQDFELDVKCTEQNETGSLQTIT